MVGRARVSRAGPSGRHFLRSPRLAAELVLAAGVASDDVVVEVGAGRGVITAELARWSASVLAVELDPALAAGLRRRFAGVGNVLVLEGDALSQPFPAEPFRLVANIPFGITGALLRRLAEPDLPLTRADLVVEAGAARKRARTRPSTLQAVLWAPWYELSVGRGLPASAFEPPPSVGAAVLVVRKRARPLLGVHERASFNAFVARAFGPSGRTLQSGLRGLLTPRQFRRAARELGFPRDALPPSLDGPQWVALYSLARELSRR